jgi:hypothetical protein
MHRVLLPGLILFGFVLQDGKALKKPWNLVC